MKTGITKTQRKHLVVKLFDRAYLSLKGSLSCTISTALSPYNSNRKPKVVVDYVDDNHHPTSLIETITDYHRPKAHALGIGLYGSNKPTSNFETSANQSSIVSYSTRNNILCQSSYCFCSHH